jgi:hypothetical protein
MPLVSEFFNESIGSSGWLGCGRGTAFSVSSYDEAGGERFSIVNRIKGSLSNLPQCKNEAVSPGSSDIQGPAYSILT